MKRLLNCLSVLPLTIFSMPSYAVDIPLKTECVGYYQVDLPDNIETALYSGEDFGKRVASPKRKFIDNKITYYSSSMYDNCVVDITHKWNGVDKYFKTRQERIKKYDLNQYTVEIQKDRFGVYNKDFLYVAFIKYNRFYSFNERDLAYGSKNSKAFYGNKYQHIVNNFTSRELFELPAQQGFCIPYGYINNSPLRMDSSVGVTYRLIDHPDITIFFNVVSSEFDPGNTETDDDVKKWVKKFWDSTYDRDVKEHHLLGTPRYKSIKIDGQNGKSAFVEIRYKDGRAPDYGYYSLVLGKNDAKSDIPEIGMYVIGKASESKGKTPLTKDEIYELAKKIEASITRRDFK